MKKKNTSVNSIEIIHDINDGKPVKEKVEIKVGSICPLPLDHTVMTARTSMLNNEGNLKALEHLCGVLKEDGVTGMSMSAIKSLCKVIKTKTLLDTLLLSKRIYEIIPEIE